MKKGLPFPSPPPLVIVISGPSGVGKDAVLARMKELGLPYHFTVTATTRPQRPGEYHGVDYYFVSEEEFRDMQAKGLLLESAMVYGHWYGVPKAQVQKALERGQDVLMKVDIQGATTVKKLFPESILIFLSPSSIEELEERLLTRKTDGGDDLALRLETAREEMRSLPLFDYVVVNYQDQAEEAVAQLQAIITAEKCRVKPKPVKV